MIAVSASIVLYKNSSDLRKTIMDVLKSSIPVSLLLIDNSPTDCLRHTLQDIITHPLICYIFNNKNLGYGAGHNVAMRQILHTSAYHLVLNPDVSFENDTIEKLVDFAEKNTGIGLLTPKVLYPNGTVQHV